MVSKNAYDLASSDFYANPYPTFRRMQEQDPVYFHAPLGVWILTRYGHIEAALRDPRFSNQRAKEMFTALMPSLIGSPEMDAMVAQWSRLLWFMDPPRHTQSRGLVNQGMSAAGIERLRPQVAAIIEDALAEVRPQGAMDVVADFADPIALNVIATLFGVPQPDRHKFKVWTADVPKPEGTGAMGAEASRRVRESSKSLFEYVFALVGERLKHPGDDMISRMLAGHRGDPALVEEVSIQCVQLIGASYITSVAQISNAVLALLAHPGEVARLRDNPSLLKSAVEEALRFQPGALSTNRLCAEDVEIDGARLEKGKLVLFVLAAANRDPAVFPEPDCFDIGRQGAKHLTFSLGHHYCPGAALARIELEESIKALLNLRRWELGDEPHAYGHVNLQEHSLRTLPMRFATP